MKKILFYWFAFLLIILFMTSCGSRKTATSETKTNTNAKIELAENKDLIVQDASNVKTEISTTTDDECTEETTTHEPVDNSKPSSYTDANGVKHELNNTKETRTKKTTKTKKKESIKSNSVTGKTTIDKGKITAKIAVKNKTGTAAKNTDSTSQSWWNFLWFLIPIIGFIIWKYRTAIPFFNNSKNT